MSSRTPEQISEFLNDNMYRMDQSHQYLGDEPNSFQKPWDEMTVRMCLFASWPYEQAAGNQSIPLVYATVNKAGPTFSCDRSYLPYGPRDWNMFADAGIPVFGIESRHQLMDFDLIGTSIAYPVLSINLVKQLIRSSIPVRWKDRTERAGEFPMILIGGQSYGAPEGNAPIVDAYWMGEVEDEPDNPGIRDFLKRVEHWKANGTWWSDRIACYRLLAEEFDFLYFPRFIDVEYEYQEGRKTVEAVAYNFMDLDREPKPSKQVCGIVSTTTQRLPRRKRFVKDMDRVEALTAPPLLYLDPGMGAGDLEVGRGCPAWCSFCALTYRQKPYRQRSVAYMVEQGKELLQNTGGIHIAPFSPDFPMHTMKNALVKELMEHVTDEVDASSMRVDDFIADGDYILLQAHAGMDQVTLGVEGNSQRMRDLVGKGCADEDIKEAVARGIRAGIRRFKLYMICDLPGEDEGDIYRILKLARELADIRDGMGAYTVKIQFSWTPLLIEANTPFQWFAPTVSNRALAEVWQEFKKIKIDFKLGAKAEKNKQTYFQLSQRASRDGGEAIVDVLEKLPHPCWGGVPNDMAVQLQDALVARGFLNGLADLFDERQKADMFGWEWLDQGISTEMLWVTYQQMREFLENTDSATYDSHFTDDYHGNEWIERCDTKCYGKTCGTCDVDDLRVRQRYIQDSQDEIRVDLRNVKIIDQKSVAMRIRARIEVDDKYRFVENDHWRYAVRRAAYRSKIPITKRTVRFASDNIKTGNSMSGADYVEFGLTARLAPDKIKLLAEQLNSELNGCHVTDVKAYASTADPLRQDVDLNLFELEVDLDPRTLAVRMQEWDAAEYIEIVIKESGYRGGETKEIFNAKDLVDDMWAIQRGHKLVLRMLVRGKASPYLIYQHLMHLNSNIQARKYPARRIEAFVDQVSHQDDFLLPTCVETGQRIPVTPLGKPYHLDYGPKALDLHTENVVIQLEEKVSA